MNMDLHDKDFEKADMKQHALLYSVYNISGKQWDSN